jgi:hypothetical protein
MISITYYSMPNRIIFKDKNERNTNNRRIRRESAPYHR